MRGVGKGFSGADSVGASITVWSCWISPIVLTWGERVLA